MKRPAEAGSFVSAHHRQLWILFLSQKALETEATGFKLAA
jgi:hypothetical protein